MSATRPDFTDQQERLERSLSRLLLAWSQLETNLCTVLWAICAPTDAEIISAMYYSQESARGRVSMVDSALQAFVSRLTDQERACEVSSAWEKFKKKERDLRSARNSAAHGAIQTVGLADGRTALRLLPQPFDFQKVKFKNLRQFPGMGPNEIDTTTARVSGLSASLISLGALIRAK